MATILGLNCKLFKRTAASSYGTPVFTAVDAVRDASYEVEVTEVDASRRGSGGWRQNETTLKNATLNATIMKDADDAMFVEIQTAFEANASMELVAYDGADASGSHGIDAMWKVTQWNETQDLEGVVQIEATFRPAPDADLSPTFISGTLPSSRP
jgi:hypothetical protein